MGHTIFYLAPVIQKFPENDVTFLEGEGLLFAIQVAGIPTPSAVWYQDGKELVSDYSLEIAGGGSLSIPSVEPRHSGSYKLVVTNQAGSLERTVKVGCEKKSCFCLSTVLSIPHSCMCMCIVFM